MIWFGSSPTRPLGYFYFTDCVRALYIGGLVLFIVSLKQESWAELGLSTPRWGKDIIIGLATVFITALFWAPFIILFNKLRAPYLREIADPVQSPSSIAEYLWIFTSAIMVGFAEELLTRGYLISRFLRLFAPWKSIVLSSLVFSAWHISKGIFGVTHTFIWGLVYGFTFFKTHRLWPVAIAHAINNIVGDFVSAM
jgi:membrane protease YdiL (CAAX protease family)